MSTIHIVIDGISNSGGTDRVASMLSNLYVASGHSVVLYSLSQGEAYYDIDDKVDIKNAKSKVRMKNLLNYVFFSKREKPDVILIISMGRLSFQMAILLKVFHTKAKVICNDHVSIESFNIFTRLLKVLTYKLSDFLVVLTEHDKNILSKKYKINNVKVVRNTSPFYDVDISDVDQSSEEKIAIAIGRLTCQKNFDRLLNIWKKANSQGWKLIIIGEGDEYEILNNRCVKEKGLENVSIEKPTKNISFFYKKADLLLMTSRYEGLPMVLIEAKNFGIPVIAFDCKTGPSEIIENDGFVIDYDSDSNYLEKLNILLTDNSIRNEFKNEALKNSQRYSPEVIKKQWEQVFK